MQVPLPLPVRHAAWGRRVFKCVESGTFIEDKPPKSIRLLQSRSTDQRGGAFVRAASGELRSPRGAKRGRGAMTGPQPTLLAGVYTPKPAPPLIFGDFEKRQEIKLNQIQGRRRGPKAPCGACYSTPAARSNQQPPPGDFLVSQHAPSCTTLKIWGFIDTVSITVFSTTNQCY